MNAPKTLDNAIRALDRERLRLVDEILGPFVVMRWRAEDDERPPTDAQLAALGPPLDLDDPRPPTRRASTVPPAPDADLSRRRWLRPRDAATRYGLSLGTLYNWCWQRRVTTRKHGTSRRAPVEVYVPDIERLARLRPRRGPRQPLH